MRPFITGIVAAVGLVAMVGQVAGADGIRRFNVAVMDSAGRAAEGVTAADLVVTEGGRAQRPVFVRRSGVQPVLVVLDLFNTTLGERGALVKETAEALAAMRETDRVYLYVLDLAGKLDAVHGLPVSEAEAAQAQGAWGREAGSLIERRLREVSRSREVNLTTGERVKSTYAALERAGSMLAALPGNKRLAWMSRGVPLGYREKSRATEIDYGKALDGLSRTLGECGVSVATIDLPVVRGATPDGLSSRETLRQLAAGTGGRYFEGGYGIGRALTGLIREAGASYTVGYRSASKGHGAVAVTAAGARWQIVAPASIGGAGRGDGRVLVDGAVASFYDATEIGVAVEAVRVGERWRVQARVDGRDAGHGELETRLVMLQGDGKRTVVDGIAMSGEYPFAENVRRVRVVVRDVQSGEIGSKTVELERGAR